MIGATVLLSLAAIAPSAASESFASEAQQLQALAAFADVLNQKVPEATLERYFSRDAVFVGAERYRWSTDVFRRLLADNRCSTSSIGVLPASRYFGGLGPSERDRLLAEGNPRGPGIWIMCPAGAWHFSFSFVGDRITEVRPGHVVAPPPLPTPSQPARPQIGNTDG